MPYVSQNKSHSLYIEQENMEKDMNEAKRNQGNRERIIFITLERQGRCILI